MYWVTPSEGRPGNLIFKKLPDHHKASGPTQPKTCSGTPEKQHLIYTGRGHGRLWWVEVGLRYMAKQRGLGKAVQVLRMGTQERAGSASWHPLPSKAETVWGLGDICGNTKSCLFCPTRIFIFHLDSFPDLITMSLVTEPNPLKIIHALFSVKTFWTQVSVDI